MNTFGIMNERSKRGSRIVLVIAIILVILVGAACGWYFLKYKPEQQAKEMARLEQIAKEEAEQKRKELEAQKKVKYDQLLVEANSAYEIQNWDSARSLYAEASSLFPNETHPKNQILLIDEKLAEIAALEVKRAAGIIETISTRTGRFYIILSSSIDDDLALDYAKKLVSQGVDTKIIEHDDSNHLYYRVAVGDFSTQKQADESVPSYSTYSSEIWVLKY